MMRNDKMIHLIEQELVQADEAQTEAEFEKHMYAIHTLTLYTLLVIIKLRFKIGMRHPMLKFYLRNAKNRINQIIIKIKCQLLKLKQWEVKYLNQ